MNTLHSSIYTQIKKALTRVSSYAITYPTFVYDETLGEEGVRGVKMVLATSSDLKEVLSVVKNDRLVWDLKLYFNDRGNRNTVIVSREVSQVPNASDFFGVLSYEDFVFQTELWCSILDNGKISVRFFDNVNEKVFNEMVNFSDIENRVEKAFERVLWERMK